ncbi:DUF427 domain-containing protein [Quadrisphaera sp. INWT6]|uniref:DUF427 domain-containing protein n=1 Tax=Quadrisphaera sp. INWT6 TaxID=2596917 RepID=UPI0018924FF3|nr:DUF427 domain-containing protein [Quadrisphaera sp. INWT6]MBF5080983.1 DUF427 domain-containing protein [Quadrisphaera sp. INWT6]
MKAVLDGVVVAEADDDAIVRIEGNAYFPPSSVVEGALSKSPTPYTCPWKGVAQYWNVTAPGGATADDGAWSYPEPYPASFDRVGSDYSGYLAFDPRQVQVTS